jgi:hypothetical protein
VLAEGSQWPGSSRCGGCGSEALVGERVGSEDDMGEGYVASLSTQSSILA